MRFVVVGATGATGRLLVRELRDRGHAVRAVVRDADKLERLVGPGPDLEAVTADVAGVSEARWAELLDGCDGAASCLGHVMSFRGVFGPPYRLVAGTARRLLAGAAASPTARPRRLVWMGSAGVRNPDLGERVSFAQRVVVGLLRALVPPHADNEQAAEHLRRRGPAVAGAVEWAVVRPDGLADAEAPTPYDVHPSPVRSAIFDAGTTSRSNVAHFMAELLTDDATWARWKGRMPVVYDRA